MRYEDSKEICQWCDKELWAVNGERPKAFCNDECRYNYHNAKKKIKAQKERIFEFINFLQESMGRNGDLAMEAGLINDAIYELSRRKSGVKVSCAQCGQRRFSKPNAGDKCPFCGDSNWLFGDKSLQAES